MAFFWVSLNMCVIFLISVIYYACNMLKIIESVATVVKKEIWNMNDYFSRNVLIFNSFFSFLVNFGKFGIFSHVLTFKIRALMD